MFVAGCGHVSCFWCVHKSMSGLRESQCPFCRHPYNHFPTICQMLHFLLLKLYPVAYKARESQILGGFSVFSFSTIACTLTRFISFLQAFANRVGT